MFAFFQFTSIKVNPYSKAERKKVGHSVHNFRDKKPIGKRNSYGKAERKKVGHSVHNFRDTKPIGKRNSYGKAERKKWDTVSTISEM